MQNLGGWEEEVTVWKERGGRGPGHYTRRAEDEFEPQNKGAEGATQGGGISPNKDKDLRVRRLFHSRGRKQEGQGGVVAGVWAWGTRPWWLAHPKGYQGGRGWELGLQEFLGAPCLKWEAGMGWGWVLGCRTWGDDGGRETVGAH